MKKNAGTTEAIEIDNSWVMQDPGVLRAWLQTVENDPLRHAIIYPLVLRLLELIAGGREPEGAATKTANEGWEDRLWRAPSELFYSTLAQVREELSTDNFLDALKTKYNQKALSANQMLTHSTLLDVGCVLLLDEPAAGLDRSQRQRLETLLGKELRAGRTIIAVSHDENFGRALRPRRLRMDAGMIL